MKQIIVIGLGKFGMAAAKALSRYDCEVMAIDESSNLVDEVAPYVTHSAKVNAMDKEALLDLGINNFDEDVFRIASIIRNKYKTKGPEIIFTDYDTTECHKLFKYEPLNFYCYPIRKEIIKVDIEKIFNRVNKEENEVLKFHYDGITKGVSFDEIIYIEAKGNNSEIYKKM